MTEHETATTAQATSPYSGLRCLRTHLAALLQPDVECSRGASCARAHVAGTPSCDCEDRCALCGPAVRLFYALPVRRDMPGELLLRPAPLVTMAVLAVNDHLLKREFGNAMTGKLSDVAGLAFTPLLALALVEVGRAAIGSEKWQAGRRDLGACVFAVGALFLCAKGSPTVGHAAGAVLGALRYPVRGEFDRVTITHDLSDLAALPALFVAWLDGWFAIRRRKASSRPRPCIQISGSGVRT